MKLCLELSKISFLVRIMSEINLRIRKIAVQIAVKVTKVAMTAEFCTQYTVDYQEMWRSNLDILCNFTINDTAFKKQSYFCLKRVKVFLKNGQLLAEFRKQMFNTILLFT